MRLVANGTITDVGTTSSGAWMDAIKLIAGQRLLNANGAFSEVVSVRTEDAPHDAYNLEVDGFHTFFVAAPGNDNAPAVWVHNACPLGRFFDGLRAWPGMPEGFTKVVNGTTTHTINSKKLLADLRQVQSGNRVKVYQDGYGADENAMSIHFFRHSSGRIFNPDIKLGHSN